MRTQHIKTFVLLGGLLLSASIYLFAQPNIDTFKQSLQDSFINNMSEQDMESYFCKEDDFACQDFIFFLDKTVKREQIPALVEGAKDDFAKALRQQKRLSINTRTGQLKQLEQRQIKRLLGKDYNMGALKNALDAGDFTIDGWGLALQNLCGAARQGKLESSKVKDLKKWTKKIENGLDKETLPVVRLNNVNPFSPGNSAHVACVCISQI